MTATADTPRAEPVSDGVKACTRCGETKPLDDFHRDREGRHGRKASCRECIRQRAAARYRIHAESYRAYSKRYRVANRDKVRTSAVRRLQALASRSPEEVEADRRRLRPDGLKRCRSCGDRLPFAHFWPDRTKADGLQSTCQDCHDRGGLLRSALPSWEERDLGGCAYCGAPFEDVDHVIPRAAGDLVPGVDLDDPRNLAPACSDCNRGPGGKFARPVLEWLEEIHPGLLSRLGSLPVIDPDGNPIADRLDEVLVD